MIKNCPNALDKLIVGYKNLKNKKQYFFEEISIFNDFLKTLQSIYIDSFLLNT